MIFLNRISSTSFNF